jgi:hypothetical protein
MSKKWEYQIESIPKPDDVIHVLNKLGEEGWELIQFSGAAHYFKREKQREIKTAPPVKPGRKFR